MTLLLKNFFCLNRKMGNSPTSRLWRSTADRLKTFSWKNNRRKNWMWLLYGFNLHRNWFWKLIGNVASIQEDNNCRKSNMLRPFATTGKTTAEVYHSDSKIQSLYLAQHAIFFSYLVFPLSYFSYSLFGWCQREIWEVDKKTSLKRHKLYTELKQRKPSHPGSQK